MNRAAKHPVCISAIIWIDDDDDENDEGGDNGGRVVVITTMMMLRGCYGSDGFGKSDEYGHQDV